MKLKKRSYFTLILFSLFIYACSDMDEMDEYKRYTNGREISYTEKMDSVNVFAGRNRAQLQGIVNADPKITNFRVYWNSKNDSITVPVERSQGIDTLSVIIDNLQENIYNFEVRTFDDEGNQSIPVYITGNVYGERYQESLGNRRYISHSLIGSNLTIDYASMDLSSGVIGTEIAYENAEGGQSEFFVPIDSTNVILDDFLGGSTYSYRTLFVPEENAIDTFYTAYDEFTPQFQITDPPYFTNASFPFESIAYDGARWGTPAGWIHNEAALSHNGFGAMDGEIFDLESGWGQADIINGKVYQTMVLEPGRYVYTIDISEINYEGADNNLDKGYFTVAEGSTLPDVDDVETSDDVFAYERINRANGLLRALTFTITEITQVSIGIQTTNDQGAGRYVKINEFSLNKITEAPYLRNTSFPFDLAADGGRWGTPEHWIHNEAALSHDGYGAVDGNVGDRFDLESGWGQPNIVNGKVYQVLYLEPGTYRYSIDIFATNYEGDDAESDNGYFTVASGDTLPDVDVVETAEEVLAWEQIHRDNLAPVLEFTLTQTSEIAIGAQTTNAEGVGRFMQVSEFTLEKID